MASMALGVNVIEIDRTNPHVVYAGTTKGLYRTANKGEERIGESIPEPFVSSIVIHPSDSAILYIGGPAGCGRAPMVVIHGRPPTTRARFIKHPRWRWSRKTPGYSMPELMKRTVPIG